MSIPAADWSEMIDLSRNENPNRLSPEIRRKLATAVEDIHRYPVRLGEEARSAAADCFGVSLENIVLTRGIDDAVDRLVWEYRDKHFFVVTPGFDGFVERLRANRVAYSALSLDADFRLPDAEIARLDKNNFVLLSNPNNPTGRRFGERALVHALALCYGALVDQTYDDFAISPVAQLPERRHVYRFRSFSKGFGLAGLRLGALIGSAPDIEVIESRAHYCSVDSISAKAVLCVTTGQEFRESVDEIIRLRDELAYQLRNDGFEILMCDANFLLLRCDSPKRLLSHLNACGILVKDTTSMGLPGHVRISIGRREDHARLREALICYRGVQAGDRTVRSPMHSAVAD